MTPWTAVSFGCLETPIVGTTSWPSGDDTLLAVCLIPRGQRVAVKMIKKAAGSNLADLQVRWHGGTSNLAETVWEVQAGQGLEVLHRVGHGSAPLPTQGARPLCSCRQDSQDQG